MACSFLISGFGGMNGAGVAMYYNWLDRWDEHRTRRRDDVKKMTGLVLDPELVFPAHEGTGNLEAFCNDAKLMVLDSDRFFDLPDAFPNVSADDQWVRFPSSLPTGIVENDTVHAQVTSAGSFDHAVIVFHHWNASSRNAPVARFLAMQGLAVVEIAMPYHLERSRPGSSHADYMLSPNLGRTLQTVRQAVVDGRQLIRVLQRAGYRRVSVLGMSLGSWVAGLVVAHDPAIQKASLLLSAGSLAGMVWTGGATQHIRASLEGKMELSELRRAWAPLGLGNYAAKLARPGLDVQFVLAKRDKVVLPALSEELVHQMKCAGASPYVKRLNCDITR
jgi:dienelactone hydrolase